MSTIDLYILCKIYKYPIRQDIIDEYNNYENRSFVYYRMIYVFFKYLF